VAFNRNVVVTAPGLRALLVRDLLHIFKKFGSSTLSNLNSPDEQNRFSKFE